MVGVDPIDAALYQIEHGPLVDFPLFHEIATLTPGVLESLQSDALMDEAKLARCEAELGAALVQMVKRADWEGLARVVRVVRHFTDKLDYPNDELKNPEMLVEKRRTFEFLRRYRDADWTLSQIQEHLFDETGIDVNRKTLKSWCEEGDFWVKPAQRGRPKGS